ncbi:MAG: hypothetical protein WKF57_20900 [Nakamurella sp.]
MASPRAGVQSYGWDTRALKAGSYRLTAVVTTASGARVTATRTVRVLR